MHLPNLLSYVLVGVVGVVCTESDACINNGVDAVSLLQMDLALWPIKKAKGLETDKSACEPLVLKANQSDKPLLEGTHLEDNSTLVDKACKPLRPPLPGPQDHFQSFCLCRQTQPLPNISSLIAKRNCPAEPTMISAFRLIDSFNIPLNSDFIAIHSGGLLPDGKFRYGKFRFDISDNQVDVSNWHMSSWGDKIIDTSLGFPKMLLDVAKEARLPKISFVLSWSDGSPAWDGAALPHLEAYQVPVLGVWRTEGRPGTDILSIPRSLSDWGKEVRAGLNRIPNASYTPTSFAVFRGQRKNVWRAEIQALAEKRPDLIDAGTNFLTDEQQMRFEVVLAPDGHSLPDRLARQMAYGKPVVFIHPIASVNEFWYPELQPWVHYVPSSGLDLEATLDTLQKDPFLTHQIGARGKQFVEGRFTEHRIRCYMYRLLEEYAARFQN
jgi:hypothetical protein